MSLEAHLHNAAQRGQLDVVTDLLDCGVTVDARDYVSLSEVIKAIMHM